MMCRSRRKTLLFRILAALIAPLVFLAPASTRATGDAPLPGETPFLAAEEADKCDLLLVCVHAGDEQRFFTGLAPLYAGEKGLSVRVAFLSHESEAARLRAIEGLSLCGASARGVFCGLPYARATDRLIWTQDALLDCLVPLMRAHRPEVIVTYGANDDALRAYAARAVLAAVDAAADEKAKGGGAIEMPGVPGAAQQGAWQVKKVYARDAEGQTAPDISAPLAAFNGESAASVSARALALYGEAAAADAEELPAYSLSYTAVGEDGEAAELFTHIEQASLTNPAYESASSLGAAARETAPAPIQAPAQTPLPAPAVTAAPALTALTGGAPRFPFAQVLIPAGAGAAMLALLLLLWRQRSKDGSFSKALLLCAFLIAAAVLIASLVLILDWRRAGAA